MDGESYLDIDLDLGGVQKQERMSTESIFFSVVDNKLFISVNGLSFTDVLYSAHLDSSDVTLKVDEDYTSILDAMQLTTFEDSVTDTLQAQFAMYTDTASVSDQLNTRYVYAETYDDGSFCDANKQPRKTKVEFYCDAYATDKREEEIELKILDISEPSWCTYLFKVSTKYMCTGVAQLPKSSSREGSDLVSARSRTQRNDVQLGLDVMGQDGYVPIVKRKVRC